MQQTLTGEGSTAEIKINQGLFSVDLAGTFTATVTLQRVNIQEGVAQVPESSWMDVTDAEYTTPVSKTGDSGSDYRYRWTIKTGNFTSGAVICVIKQ